MPLQIARVPMTRQHYRMDRRGQAIRILVMHATAGSHPGDYEWLRRGGSVQQPVSVHYYIAPDGAITQFVDDAHTAWHAGASAWRGLETPLGAGITTVNYCSLGIELSHANRADAPHRPEQIAAAIALARMLVGRYQIERANLVRHLDVAPGRKTDPAALDWTAFVAAVYAGGSRPCYTDDSPILAPAPAVHPERIAERIVPRAMAGSYTAADVLLIVSAYWRQASDLGIDPLVAIAQMCHETGYLTSFWSQRPQRNPAGIGVTGEVAGHPAEGYVYHPQHARWERGLSFASWIEASIPAHLGRLLAYALPADQATPAQRLAMDVALAYRPLPPACRGAAPTLRTLGAVHHPVPGCGWASPGATYGARIAAVANALLGGAPCP